MSGRDALRFGVLGAARIVPKALIQPAHETADAQVVAVAARDPLRARHFAALHGIPRVFATYMELLEAPGIDAVYIPLPNSMHCEWTIRALRSGKHVLCEKPFSCNAAEAVAMAQAARETGLILSEGFHYLYHPLAARIRSLIHDGEIGDLVRIEVEFSAPIPPPNIRYELGLGGGASMDLGCYGLNMIRYFSGASPEVSRASAVIGPREIDVAMKVELELPGGASAQMKCSMAHDAPVSVFFVARGSRGKLRATNPVAPQRGHLLTVRRGGHETRESVAGASTFFYQLRAFADAIHGGRTLATNPEEAVANMRLIDQVYLAAGLKPRGANPPATIA